MEPYLDHERLDVYRLWRKLNRQVADLLSQLPSGHHESINNFRRAVKSIGRNLAEGAGRWHPADKVHFYLISRGSGTEAAASLDEFVDFGIATETQIQPARHTLIRIIAMLTNMIRTTEARASPSEAEPPHNSPMRP